MTCQERYRIKKIKKKMEHRFGAGACQANRDTSWLPWLGGLDDGAHTKGCAAVRGTAASVQLEEELIVLETDEARAQLDCKAVL